MAYGKVTRDLDNVLVQLLCSALVPRKREMKIQGKPTNHCNEKSIRSLIWAPFSQSLYGFAQPVET